jgi:diguanylate cyclase (GGDEF)-like protein
MKGRVEQDPNGLSEARELVNSFLLLFIPASLILAMIFFAFSNQTREYELQTVLLQEELAIDSASELTSLIFEQKFSDLMVLAEGEVLRHYLHDSSLRNWAQVGREFSLLARRKPSYFQVRYIANDGMERVRIDYGDNGVQIIAHEALQDKAERYYFKEAIGLAAGTIYLSPLDLNVEHGEIESPIKPTIRLATPVLDGYGVKRGIVIINYSPQELLQGIAGNFKALQGDAMMLNSEGYWLQGGPEGGQWGFMYDSDDTFAKRNPDVWAEMSSSQGGVHFASDGVYVFQKVYPLVQQKLGTLENLDYSAAVAPHSDSEKRHFIYLSYISNELIEELTAKRLLIAGITYLLLFLVVAVISYLFARNSVQKKMAFHKLQLYATTDDLTGVANRRELDKVAQKEFKRATRFSRQLSVLMLDLDHFKNVNDSHGHDVGDRVLKHVAGLCADSIRGQDFLARYGGEEFTILLPETDIENAARLAQRICDDIAVTPYQDRLHLISCTLSVGISEIEDNGDDVKSLFNRADKALYEAKRRGRNRVVIAHQGQFHSHRASVEV